MTKKYLQDWYNNNDISKAISYEYDRYSYDAFSNNCEHLVKSCVFGIEESPQTEVLEVLSPFHSISSSFRAVKKIIDSLEDKIKLNSDWLDSLTSSYSYEKGRIERHTREAENNRSYTRSKYQIEQEKFQERIVVYPKDWCRIS